MGKTALTSPPPPARRAPASPHLVRKGPVSRRDLVSLAVPGPPEEAEEFVDLLLELRRKTKPRLVAG
jgi:hypothetical protein